MSLPVARLSAAQSSAFERCAALAARRGLRVLGRGVAKVEPFQGCPVWLVSSSRPAHASHLVWLFRGHLLCSCEAGAQPHIVTCSHAALVRLSLAERAAVPASVPVPASESSEQAGGSSAIPVPPPPAACPPCPICALATTRTTAGALVCPSCGALCPDDFGPLPDDRPPAEESPTHCSRCGLPVDPDELAQLGGECLDCLLDLRHTETRQRERTSSEHTAIIARERERQARYRREGRTSETDIRLDPAWQPESETDNDDDAPPAHPGASAPLAPRPAFSIFKAG